MQSVSSSSPSSSSSSTLLLSPSPSLSCYSSGNNTLAQIAARVAHELSLQDHHLDCGAGVRDSGELFFHEPATELPQLLEEEEEGEEQEDDESDDAGDEEFEFSFACGGLESSPISADLIFHNGRIRPMYEFEYEYSSPVSSLRPPLADRRRRDHEDPRGPRRPALKLLMSEEDPRAGDTPEPGFSCSSSESDELEGVSPETYCVWAPRESAPGREPCRKSSSTGSGSRRWKLKHLLLNRSNSDGRTDALGVLPPNKAAGDGGKAGRGSPTPTEGQVQEGGIGKRRSYLPYRTDLVGFFSNVNGLGRDLHPFR